MFRGARATSAGATARCRWISIVVIGLVLTSPTIPAQAQTFSQAVNFAVGGFPEGVAVGQLRSSTSNLDIVIADNQGNLVDVLLGNGDGTFQPMVGYNSGGTCPVAVALGDVNGDKVLDIVVATQCGGPNGHGTVGVLIGNGDGTFQPVVIYDSGGTSPNSNFVGAVVVADVNGDGKPDIVVANQAGSTSGDGTVGVLIGNGDGTFQPVVPYDSGGSGTNGLAVADLNGDGYPDLIVSNNCLNPSSCASQIGGVAVLLNNSAKVGTFAPAVSYATGGPSTSVAVGNLNADTYPDLVVGLGTYGAQVFLNNGDGTFPAGQNLSTNGQVTAVAIRDVNGDGINDVAVGLGYCGTCDNGMDSGVSVALGNGDGTLRSFVTYEAARRLSRGACLRRSKP